jgi:hypothetical protein
MDGEYMRPGAAPWEDASHASFQPDQFAAPSRDLIEDRLHQAR